MMGPMLASLAALVLTDQARPLTSGPGIRREVALTFDACQTKKVSGYDAKVIKVLKDTNTKATLFLGGAWVQSHPQQATALGRDPHFEIAQHSFLHPHFKTLSRNGALSDLKLAQDAVRKATGHTPSFFRPPYGEWDKKTLEAAAELGLRTVLWSVVTGDPDKHVTAKDIVSAVLKGVKPGAIVIMHMNGHGWHTAEALPTVIAGLRAKGYTLVRLSELMRK